MSGSDQLLQFVRLIHRFDHVERRIYFPGEERRENDAEHSYQLAITAWYIINVEKLSLSSEKAMKYALAHDLVEIDAGDTFMFETDQTVQSSKVQREQEAADKLAKDFVEFSELHEYIQGYENLVDEESKFIYALDKFLPFMDTYLDSGRTWKEEKLTLKKLLDMQLPKISQSPVIRKYYDQIISIVEKNQDKFFHS